MINIEELKSQIENIEIDIETHYDFLDDDEFGYHLRSIQTLNVEKDRILKRINAILFNSSLNSDLHNMKNYNL